MFYNNDRTILEILMPPKHGINTVTSILRTTLLFAALLVGNSYAIDPHSTLPIEIESDSATLDESKGMSHYQGNVIISQGKTKLEADEISVTAIEKRIVQIQAVGSPAHFQQADEGDSLTHGYAETITYQAEDAILKFERSAKLVQNTNSFSGETIEYDLRQKAIKAQGNKQEGERVKIQYHPTAQSDATDNNTSDAVTETSIEPEQQEAQ